MECVGGWMGGNGRREEVGGWVGGRRGVVPISFKGRVGNHSSFEVETTVCDKDQGVKEGAVQGGRGAAQDLAWGEGLGLEWVGGWVGGWVGRRERDRRVLSRVGAVQPSTSPGEGLGLEEWVGGWVGRRDEMGGWVGGWVGGETDLGYGDGGEVGGEGSGSVVDRGDELNGALWRRWVGGWVGGLMRDFLLLEVGWVGGWVGGWVAYHEADPAALLEVGG